jgi:hypothetical protein
MPWFAERETYFRISFHSHTKGFEEAGYVPIVTVTRGLSTKIRVDGRFVGRWFKNSKAAKFGRFLVLVGRVCA